MSRKAEREEAFKALKQSRSLARETAFKAIFQLDFNSGEGDEREIYENLAIDTAIEHSQESSEVELKAENLAYINGAVKNAVEHRAEIDAIIKNYLKENWTLARLAAADRNILRLAVYEMKFAESKIPVGVAINEAVTLAKRYGTDDSGRFVNGILDAIAK